MTREELQTLADNSLEGIVPSPEVCEQLLTDPDIELPALIDAAYKVRKHFKNKDVTVHILNNAQSGHCPEDCGYCSQAKTSDAEIVEYPLKKEEEILEEARLAHAGGAFRYCMVYAGTGASQTRVNKLASIIKSIKEKYPIEVCVSTGILSDEQTHTLKDAGLDRLNHNLNTSEEFYPEICTTHTYQDRVNTLKSAHAAGLEVCSGMIIGMGESAADIVDVAQSLRKFAAPSIPINFLVPIPGNRISEPIGLTPEFCLRVLAMFRFVNPTAEIRAGAGREGHLRGLEAMALYAADSLFLDGYLTTRGSSRTRTLRLIRDAGFNIVSEHDLDDLLEREGETDPFEPNPDASDKGMMKSLEEMRPAKV